jgi:hypothetical protein
MGKWTKALGLTLAGLGYTGYYQYHESHAFRSVCNLVYAGANMAYIYKYDNDPT